MQSSPPMVRLADTDLLDRDRLKTLGRWSIRTVEDLVGAIESDESSISMLLRMTHPQLSALHGRALDLLAPEVRQAFDRQRGRHYPLGALRPDGLAK